MQDVNQLPLFTAQSRGVPLRPKYKGPLLIFWGHATAGKVLISLNEVGRYAVIEQVLWRAMEQSDAALWLGVSVRHVKRQPRAVRNQGTAGVISRRRGVPSSTAAYLHSF